MRPALLFLTTVALVAGAGCGAEIGDSCVVSTDCSIDGTRQCDLASDGGYCTIQGCDYGTCPSESECVSFFLGTFTNQACMPATEDCVVRTCPLDPSTHQPMSGPDCSVGTCPHAADYSTETPPTDDCNADELCALDGHCVDRWSEIRYCMKTCSSGGDCRDGYECRDEALMIQDGGEPVPAPGTNITSSTPQPFCAQAPTPP